MSVPTTRAAEEIDSLITTTWYSVLGETQDQIFKITPFLNKLLEDGRIRERVPSGTHWEVPVRYAKLDQNIKAFTRGDTFSLAEKEHLTRLIWYPKNVGTSMTRYWSDEVQNTGPAKLLDYVEELVDNTRLSLLDYFETSLLNDKSATDPNNIHGLDSLISTTPSTGTLGGKNRANNSWMVNQTNNMTGVSFATTGVDRMVQMWNNCSQFKGMGPSRSPNLIICDKGTHEKIESATESSRTYFSSLPNGNERANLGFGNLTFKGAELFWAPECPAETMFFLNTGSMEFRIHPGFWMTMTDWKPIAGNSLDRTAQVVCRCNLIANHFQNQGVIYNINTA